MKPNQLDKISVKKTEVVSCDNNIKYKINKKYVKKSSKPPDQISKKNIDDEDETIRYKFPIVTVPKLKLIPKEGKSKQKPKPKIKVNFWSNKNTATRLNTSDKHNDVKLSRRHTIARISEKPKSPIKVRKRVSFLPSPLFSDNHVPMVTVPDDLTIHLNEEEANDLGEDLNNVFVNSHSSSESNLNREKSGSISQISTKGTKRRKVYDNSHNNDNELEFFSKYVVQKLRKMETNQRIYSENLINTVLMLGQLDKLSGKSRIIDS